MTSQTTIFDEPRVNIPQSRYEKLLEYEKICKDMLILFKGDEE